MLFVHRWIAVTLCLLLSGCTLFMDARRTLFIEPKVFSWKKDPAHSKKLYRSWADNAWQEHCAAFPEMQHAQNYIYGFKDGFVDFVYAGGNGEPPPVPPRRFWNADWRSPNGHQMASQWFSGFRDGARVAREGGFREQAILQPLPCLAIIGECELPQFQDAPAEPIEEIGLPEEALPLPTLESPPLPKQTASIERNSSALSSMPAVEPDSTDKPLPPTTYSPILSSSSKLALSSSSKLATRNPFYESAPLPEQTALIEKNSSVLRSMPAVEPSSTGKPLPPATYSPILSSSSQLAIRNPFYESAPLLEQTAPIKKNIFALHSMPAVDPVSPEEPLPPPTHPPLHSRNSQLATRNSLNKPVPVPKNPFRVHKNPFRNPATIQQEKH